MDDKIYKIGGYVVDVCLILGIVYLASKGVDGWGWLIFIFLIKNH